MNHPMDVSDSYLKYNNERETRSYEAFAERFGRRSTRFSAAPFIRDRPRGLGLLQLPTGMTDERSGPFFPNLYIAGDKAGEKPAAVSDVHLPGQTAVFSGR
ncbi:hypothetical protein ANCDUO_24566 [Ancylostoma duodenale]|uniref:Uncharacterized protein n=1 Tax=Ancylostoma duodenale TaxID=51022 RepID=A0A0C2BNK4_9BILA|nr:hypothetical protein ANCDUO_24566 [Ancylostoma duodenale]